MILLRKISPACRFWLLLLVLVLLLTTGCSAATTGDGNGMGPASGDAAHAASSGQIVLSVSGAFALFPLMTVWTQEYQALHPELTFDVQAGGAGKGMTDMLSGAADIAMLSREPRSEELEQGSFLIPVTVDSVLATVNAENPNLDALLNQGLTAEEAHGLWITQDIKTWGQLLGNGSKESVNVYTRSDSSGAAEMWALFALGEAQEELRGTAVNGDPGVAEAVRQDPLGIGYNNVGFAYDQSTGNPIAGLRTVPLDLNGDGQISDDEAFYETRVAFTAAVAAGHYPFPPARTLYLVTKGAPDDPIVDFYRWVLTDGQAFVDGAGYVPLTGAQIEEALGLLGE